jgi:alpha-beta hydrolase superfamily lysophospholipase
LDPGLIAAPVEARLNETRFVTDDGLELPLRAWLPDAVRDGRQPRAVILALHGFNDYSKAFEAAGEFWAGQGIATYAYDQRGFGAAPNRGYWAGAPAMIADLRAAIGLLRAAYQGVPLYLLGDSMGGAVILTAAAQDTPLDADGAILVAPAVWSRATMPALYRATLWFGAHVIPWAKVTGRGLDIQPSDNIEMLRALGRDPLVIKETRIDAIHGLVDLMDEALAAAPDMKLPALLLYGEKDEVVPEDPTLRLWQSLPAAERGRQRRALYGNGYHMLLRDLQAEVVWRDIAGWIADPAAPLPSGAEERALARLNGGAS